MHPSLSSAAIIKLRSASPLLVVVGTLIAGWLLLPDAVGEPGSSFDFANYDTLKPGADKNAIATHDMNAAFPSGTPTETLVRFVKRQGGYCRAIDYVPQVDKAAMPGDRMYCEVPVSLLHHWSIGVQYKKQSQSLVNLKAFYSRNDLP